MAKRKNSLLWEIKGANIKSPSYVFGTMHVQDERAFKNITFLEDCIASVEAFAAEYDLDTENPTSFADAMYLPDGQKLSQLLGPIPFFLTNILSTAQFGMEMNYSLDHYLYESAKAKQKTVFGLESFESQLEIVKKMPMKEQLKSLKEFAVNFKRYRRSIKRTAELYVEGNLVKILKKVKKNSGGMRKLLLYDRNIIMAEKILELSTRQSLFAAIGAGHLGGKKGVLRLLKNKGLEVRPVYY